MVAVGSGAALTSETSPLALGELTIPGAGWEVLQLEGLETDPLVLLSVVRGEYCQSGSKQGSVH